MTETQSALSHYEKRNLLICNLKGLHARAAAKFVRTVGGYSSRVWVTKDGNRVAGDAIMDLLMLAAAKDSTIALEADGPDSTEVLDALQALIADKFGEKE